MLKVRTKSLEEAIKRNGRKPRIAFLHREVNINLGDQLATPYHYFDFFKSFSNSTIFDIGWPGCSEQIKIMRQVHSFDLIIVGGGGLIGTSSVWDATLKLLGELENTVIWSAGLNRVIKDHKSYTEVPEYVSNYSLVAMRDSFNLNEHDNIGYIGDVTCMAPEFDHFLDSEYVKSQEDKHITVAIYAHSGIPIERNITCRPGMHSESTCTDVGCLWSTKRQSCFFANKYETNRAKDLSKILKHMRDSTAVLTSSYHGLWWSILLGKKVIVHPFLEKLTKYNLLPYKSVALTNDLYGDIIRAQTYPNALKRCRYENEIFYSKTLEILLQSLRSRRVGEQPTPDFDSCVKSEDL
ncbi:hypothetical protein FGB62_381g00 [Gracilaria domingensis]|nr:hypothetical protein FGB62_381g00 [Gracilaria domingensis]